MSENKYDLGERVFAKLKGFPPWPAKIHERVPGKEEKYRIVFFGTYDESTVKLDQLFKYTEETKAKYGKPQRKAKFKEAMQEIEADLDVLTNDEDAVELEMETRENEIKGESDGGELTIDEGPPSLPPILTREVINKSDNPEVNGNKSKKPRTLSKRDSTNPASVAPPPSIIAPSTPEPNQPPGPEIVSRSGRKIKPKRFADDEITSPVTAVKGGKVEEGPPTKRAKRATKSTGKVSENMSQMAVEEPIGDDELEAGEELAGSVKKVPPKMKTAATPNSPISKQPSRLSPDISAMNSEGKIQPSKAASARRGSTTTAGNKKASTLTPNSSSSIAKSTPAVRKSERASRTKSIDEQPSETTDLPGDMDEHEVDKENSDVKPSIEDEEMSESAVEETMEPKSNKIKLPLDKKTIVTGDNGLQYELSYQMSKPNGITAEDKKIWESVANTNVKRLEEELSKSETESHQELITSLAESIDPLTSEHVKSREKRTSQIRLLRLEGEVIEIIGEVVGCLGSHSADCVRAIELLERLEGHQLNTLMLKKHPEVVETIRKLRCYIGNVNAWNYTPDEQEQFNELSLAIRQKAVSISQHFVDVFETDSQSFVKVYNEELRKFRDKVQHLSVKTVLGLTEESDTGELEEFHMEMNGDAEDMEQEFDQNGDTMESAQFEDDDIEAEA